MWKYVLSKWYSWVLDLRIKRMRRLVDSYSKLYNDKKVMAYANVGLNTSIHNGKILLIADRHYIYCNREGFLLARRRGMFDKKTNWTDALRSAIYSTK